MAERAPVTTTVETPRQDAAGSKRLTLLVTLSLACVTFLVYLPVTGHEFVNYDDSDYVTANRHVQNGLAWETIVWAFTSGHASNWHPLTWLSHALDWQLFGSRPGGHHLVNVAFHVANTLLVFLVFKRLTRAFWACALMAAFFGLHPVHVESVAWVSERKDVLSGFFFLLTLWAYAAYCHHTGQLPAATSTTAPGGGPQRDSAGSGPEAALSRRRAWFILTLFLFALGLMSKPMLVTLPFALLLVDYWPLNRFQLGTSRTDIRNLTRLVLEKVPFFLLAAVSSWITFVVQKQGGAVSTSISLGARISNALISYVRYLGKSLWPDNLSVLYPHPGHWPAMGLIAATALLLLITAAVWALARSRPWQLVGWAWFVGMLVPVIGLVQVGIQSMADRYMYLPLIGLLIMVLFETRQLTAQWWSGVTHSPKRSGAKRPVRPVAVPGVLVICSALAACAVATRAQIGHWRNSETLFRQAVRVTKKNYLAYNNLGYYLSGQGKVEEAIENYRHALAIQPQYEDALNNLGYALAGRKQFHGAIIHYEAALRVRPNHPEVHNNLGNALAELGRLDEAINHYLQVLKHKPEHADAHNNLGIALAMQGKVDQAIPHFEQAIRFKTNYAGAHSNLGNAYAVQRRFDEAIQQYRLALRFKPDDAQAHNNLANVLTEQGQLDEATSHYTQALRFNTDNPEAHYNLGLVLARQGKLQAARSHYTEALRLKPDYPDARRQLESLARP